MPDGLWINDRMTIFVECRKLMTNQRFRLSEESSGFSRAQGQAQRGRLGEASLPTAEEWACKRRTLGFWLDGLGLTVAPLPPRLFELTNEYDPT